MECSPVFWTEWRSSKATELSTGTYTHTDKHTQTNGHTTHIVTNTDTQHTLLNLLTRSSNSQFFLMDVMVSYLYYMIEDIIWGRKSNKARLFLRKQKGG